MRIDRDKKVPEGSMLGIAGWLFAVEYCTAFKTTFQLCNLAFGKVSCNALIFMEIKLRVGTNVQHSKMYF